MIRDIPGSLNKRSSKRYTYLPQARFESQGTSQGIQVRDISKSGLQFFSNSLIQTNAPIVVTWQDQTVGALNPFLLVVRKIEQEQPRVFRYCYGSQYFNLRHETKQHIEKLVTQTKNEEREANKKLIENITVDTLLSIIRQGRAFLEELLKGHDDAKLFTRFTREIKDYEKRAFGATDDVSQFIQKLTTHNFHACLLNIAIPYVPKNNARGFALYQETVKKVEMISQVIIEAKRFMESKPISESATRLLYNKLELLQTFVETYESNGVSSKDAAEPVKKIVDEYNRTSPKPSRTSPPKPRR